jgi:glycerophosphoryl diester phosphodiesterase
MSAPLVLGHRGASARETENTLEAFAAALADGADGVELDVRLCKSGEVVVFHDDELSRLAGDARRVAELTLAELGAIELRGGRRIPTLDQVLGELDPTALINVEVKSPGAGRAGRLVRAICAVLRRHRRARVLLSSFDPTALLMLRALAPRVPRGLLCGSEQSLPLREGWAAPALAPVAIHPERVLVDADRMRRWRRRGLDVNVWTVDELAEARVLADLGVAAIITNRPAELCQGLRWN